MLVSGQPEIANDQRTFTHWVDEKDRIVQVNQDWRDFAVENKAAGLTADAVIGASLWSFISDIHTTHLYQTMLEQVRQTGKPILVSYRCDAPDRRRYMQMTISRLSGSMLELSSQILRQELREPVKMMEVAIPRSTESLVACGWCKKIRLPSEEWVEVEKAVEILGLFDAPILPAITHSICPLCLERAEKAAGL